MWTRNWIQTLHYDLSNNRLFVLSFRMKTILMSTLWVQVSCGPAGSDFYCPSCPCENDTKKNRSWHQKFHSCGKNSFSSAKTFAALCPRLTNTPKNPQKKIPRSAAVLERKTASHFNSGWNFLSWHLGPMIWNFSKVWTRCEIDKVTRRSEIVWSPGK